MNTQPPPGAALWATLTSRLYSCGCLYHYWQDVTGPPDELEVEHCPEHDPNRSAQQARRDRAYIENHDFPF